MKLTTTAAVLFKTGKPLRLVELTVPDLQRGQVLVKVAYSGVCRSQLMEVRGGRGPDRWLPHLLGHEGSGVVVGVGPGVRKVKKGDRVVLTWIRGTGLNAPGPQYRLGKLAINAGAVTTFSTYTIVAENRCVRIPRRFPLDVAALFGCAIPTGAGIVMNQVRPPPGSTAGVFGVGGVGLGALAALRLYRCAGVLAVDQDRSKLALARRFGATRVADTRRGRVERAVRDMTGGRGLDFAIEAGGSVESIEAAFRSVRDGGGLCVFASHPPAGEKICLEPHDLIRGKRIEGSWGGGSHPDRDVPRWVQLYRSGRVPLEEMIARRFSLAEVNRALDVLEKGVPGRVLIDMSRKAR